MVVFQSFLTALVLALAAMPVLIRIAQQRGFVDLPDQRKLHQRPIPLLGGLGIVSSVTGGDDFTWWVRPYK